MSQIPILHHYPASPFSEKVRLAMGLKGLRYQSVHIPAVLPKPDVMALTGGYRRTPLLQLGSDVYCDTALILHVLETLEPNPTLYAHPAAESLAQWADGPLFDVAVGLASRPTQFDEIIAMMQPSELERFAEDRKGMREQGHRALPHYNTARGHLPAYLERIEAMLTSTGHCVLDAQPGVADLSVYHCLWFIRLLNPQLIPEAGPIADWMARIAALGHGSPEPLSGTAAIALCAEATGEPGPAPTGAPEDTAAGLIGQQVTVRPDDWGRDPVTGELLACDAHHLVLQRQDPRAGRVRVHFPRVGYELRRA